MTLYRLERIQVLPISVEEAWRFFSDPSNLHEITPPELGLRVTSELPGQMYAGMVITYRLHPFFGVRIGWVTEITHVDEPRSFVDEQRFGPYRFWHHLHTFVACEAGVEMRDLVHYALPFGLLGRLFPPLVRAQLEGIFDSRRETLIHRFGDQHE